MKKLLIALDLDGVIFDFLGQFLKLHNLKNGTRVTADDISSFMPDKSLKSLITEREWGDTFEYFEEAGGYATLKSFEGVRTAIENIIREGHKLTYITSRHPSFRKNTEFSFIMNKIPLSTIHFCGNGKGRILKKVNPDIFVDDNIINCDVAHSLKINKIYLMDAPYNKECKLYSRVFNLIQIEREICEQKMYKMSKKKENR
jgi:5'(3')-deoxyribonucleotidase